MANNSRIYWLHCLTPTHVGTGRGVGYIDLPLYREQITGWPALPGSGFKGVWADYYRATKEARAEDTDTGKRLRAAFGVADLEKDHGGANAGALIATDARLVCLPVRSFMGTFAWCTSWLALKFLQRDLELSGFAPPKVLPPEAPTEENARQEFERQAFVCPDSALKEGNGVYLEDLDFTADEGDAAVKEWAEKIAAWVFPGEDAAWQAEFVKRFAVLPDFVFDYLTQTGTEVTTRVRIEDGTKIVAKGQLWTEEALPAESILAGVVNCDRVYVTGVSEQEVLTAYAAAANPLTLQIGGKASVGRGKVRCVFTTA